MKTHQLIEIENVKNANRALKNLLERTRTEVVGLGLFYGKPGLGKTRWAWKTAFDNDYIYFRLEVNMTTKNFISGLLSKLLQNNMPFLVTKGNKNDLYQQVLDILQSKPDIVLIIDEVDYAFQNKSILATIRDWSDQSLATFVLVGMQETKSKLLKLQPFYHDRFGGYFEFQGLRYEDTEKILRGVCEVKLDDEIIKFLHGKCNGTMRILNKFIDAIEKISKRLKIKEIRFDEIKDILTTVEVK